MPGPEILPNADYGTIIPSCPWIAPCQTLDDFFPCRPVIKARTVRNYYVLPCCLLLLNLCTGIVSYKAGSIYDPLLRTATIMAMVLFGGSLVGFVLEPAITWFIGFVHQKSHRTSRLVEIVFLALLGLAVFWLYYRMYILGPKSILPVSWWNARR
jgi:hypothetical protein